MTYTETVYLYDGSFDGLLCCVFAAFEQKEEPADIDVEATTLFRTRRIETDDVKAARVKRGIERDVGKEVSDTVKLAYLGRERGVELKILRLIRLGYRFGADTMKRLDDPLVCEMFHLAKAVNREKHRIIEFLRFSDYRGNLISVINPKYFVLPLIKSHFVARFPNENFFIYDETHRAALAKVGASTAVAPVDDYQMPDATEEEEKFRALWKLFYETVEIKERRNYKLRMQHLPKRFWKNITELSDQKL